MSVSKAIEILKKGGIVIFPTDTAFGIGCRVDDYEAVKRLFKIRNRPENQPAPVLVDSVSMAEKVLSSPLPDNVRHLMKDYWPGSLTVIWYCRKNLIPPPVRGGGGLLGVRVPDHSQALTIIKGTGVPILGPSANFHGKNTPFEFKDLDPALVRLADFTVPGDCTVRQVSTVIDTTPSPWRIIRQGASVVEINLYKRHEK